MQIPSKIEHDIWCGKAVYRTFQTGVGGQTNLQVGQNQYVIIFGYVFSPAGTGIGQVIEATPIEPGFYGVPSQLRPFCTQQILFYTGDDFYPFVENVSVAAAPVIKGSTEYIGYQLETTPRHRATYIRSNQSVSIAVGLVAEALTNTIGTIPVTETTPPNLSYGGSGQPQNVQTDFGGFPNQFLQPQIKGWETAPYGYGLIPANATDQAWASPDAGAGAINPSNYINGLAIAPDDSACYHYYLTLHYALYNAASDTKLQ